MSFIKNIFNVGVGENLPKYLQEKVYLNNQVALIVGFMVALPFIFISYVFFRPITFIPFAGLVSSLLIIGISWLGYINVSRIINSVLPFLLAFSFNAYLTKSGEEPVAGIYVYSLSFALIPFLVFDLTEKFSIIFAVTLMMTAYLFTDQINELLKIDIMDTEVIRKGFLATVSIVISVLTAWASVGVMAYFNHEAKLESTTMLKKMEAQMIQIKESEYKLKSSLKEVEKAQNEEKKRSWANVGLNKFSEILRSGEDVEIIYRKLISNIVEYMGANQGGLFIVEENEKGEIVMKLVSCYAYSREKYLEKEIRPGQSLLGQVYLEGEKMLIKQIPNNYVSITSGLGEATPDQLLIVPFKVNETIEAIVEIASFSNFETHQIEFLEKLGEGVASSISIIKADRQTKLLLQESQVKTEELSAQEEEMRQNMEELNATQEEMSRKEREYLNKINNLEKKIGVFESSI